MTRNFSLELLTQLNSLEEFAKPLLYHRVKWYGIRLVNFTRSLWKLQKCNSWWRNSSPRTMECEIWRQRLSYEGGLYFLFIDVAGIHNFSEFNGHSLLRQRKCYPRRPCSCLRSSLDYLPSFGMFCTSNVHSALWLDDNPGYALLSDLD